MLKDEQIKQIANDIYCDWEMNVCDDEAVRFYAFRSGITLSAATQCYFDMYLDDMCNGSKINLEFYNLVDELTTTDKALPDDLEEIDYQLIYAACKKAISAFLIASDRENNIGVYAHA